AKRDRNVRAALGRIIEKVGDVRVTGASIVAAITTLSKISGAGQWIDRSERVNLNDLFERMSHAELAAYAATGMLPNWFDQTIDGFTARLLALARLARKPSEFANSVILYDSDPRSAEPA